MTNFYWCSREWSRKSGTEDLDSLVRGGKNCEHLFFIKNNHKFLELYEGSGAPTLSIGLVLCGI